MGEGNIKHVAERRLWDLSNLDFLVWSSIKIVWVVKTLREVSTWTMANPWLDSAVCQLFFFFFKLCEAKLFCSVLFCVFSFSYACWLWNTDTCNEDLSYTWSDNAKHISFLMHVSLFHQKIPYPAQKKRIKTFEDIKQNTRKLRTWERVKEKRKYTKV